MSCLELCLPSDSQQPDAASTRNHCNNKQKGSGSKVTLMTNMFSLSHDLQATMVSLALSILSAFDADEEEPRIYTLRVLLCKQPQVAHGKYQHRASTLADTQLKCD